MEATRRKVVAGLAAAALGNWWSAAGATSFSPKLGPRSRVMFVNDLSGDVDGLFAAAHALMSPSIDVRGIVGTATGVRNETAQASVLLAHELLRVVGRDVPVHPGATDRLSEDRKPIRSAGTQAIIDEALRTDTRLPLYVAVGGGLTEVASAILLEPSIVDRFTLIWIGGTRSPDTADTEYNVAIDRRAARFVFNDTALPIWQVPREAYATCAVSMAEIEAVVAPCGPVGKWLFERLAAAAARYAGFGMNTGETWIMGDNPLVLLTALTDWVPSAMGRQPRYERTGSSVFEEVPAPRLDDRGRMTAGAGGRRVRVYSSLDTRMMFADFHARLRLQAAR